MKIPVKNIIPFSYFKYAMKLRDGLRRAARGHKVAPIIPPKGMSQKDSEVMVKRILSKYGVFA